MRRTTTGLICTTLMISSVALTACGSTSQGSAGASGDACPTGDITWWVQMPYSGPVGAVGTSSTAAMQAAVGVVNKEGGVLGHQLKLVKVDTGADPTKAVSNVQQMVAGGDKPTIVTPGLLSGETLASLPLVNGARIPTVITASSPAANDVTKFPYTFNVGSTSASSAIPAVVQELKARGFTKYAVAASDDATGLAQLQGLEEAAKGGGFSVTSVSIPSDTIDPIPQLSKLQAQNPDVLVYATGPGPLTPAVLGARTTMGWDVPTHGVPVSTNSSLKKLPAGALEGVTITVPKFGVAGSEVQQGKAYQTYIAAVQAELGGKDKVTQTPEIYANPYSMIIAGAAALKKAGSCDPDKVRAAFQSLTVSDAPLWFTSSAFDFTADRHVVTFAPDDYESIPTSSPLQDGSFVAS